MAIALGLKAAVQLHLTKGANLNARDNKGADPANSSRFPGASRDLFLASFGGRRAKFEGRRRARWRHDSGARGRLERIRDWKFHAALIEIEAVDFEATRQNPLDTVSRGG